MVKCPTTTTAIPTWNSCGGFPVLATATLLLPSAMVKSVPTAVGWIVPAHHVTFEIEGPGAQSGAMGEGLVNGVEEIERASEPLDEQEDERGQQDGEDQPQALAAPATGPAEVRARLGRRPSMNRGKGSAR